MVNVDAIYNLLVGANLQPEDDSWETDSKLRDYNNKHDKLKYNISNGASKVCLIFPGLDFVIKWSCEQRDYYESCDEAMDEVTIYADAVARNLGKFFPKTELWFSWNGINFVKQEKIDTNCYNLSGVCVKKYRKTTRTVSGELVDKVQSAMNQVHGYRREIDALWIKMLLSLYGKKAVKALCEFIQTHDINDLHDSNTGYKNNRPIILDFSGYHRD